ncbi:transcriptional regulator [Vibrio sp. vnigr-6D03]|uniref:S24 family peptidase n=1 Tax=Vibrio sp. vnigr-6D03 TaxID=2058088 RepID=UPI000C338855|nr:S24 family peptidase [Vibrio sp. vnigr-6D03]PKF77309.1 transcriptional regulator [Vibrio sp. vnigr-6D03]
MSVIDEKINELKLLTKTAKNTDLAKALGINPNSIQNWRTRGNIPDDVFIKARLVSQNLSSESSEMIRLTYYDVEASAGNGALVEIEIAKDMSFAERYLRDELHVNPSEVFLMRAKGDSMYPTLKDGSMMMVKRVQDFSGDGIYVFRVNGQVMVKRLQFQPTRIIFKSDNEQFYEPWKLTHKEIESIDFEILGQAVWGGGKL